MAKRMKRLLAVLLALTLCIGTFATPAFARDHGGHGRPGNNNSDGYEWYQVIVNGSVAASGQGPNGDVGWLVRGVYSYGVSMSGTIMYWNAGNQSGSVNVANYISIPEGFEVAEGGYTVTSHSVSGTNSQSAQYDNAIITVNITALYNPTTGETLPVETKPEETEPEATEPEVTEPETTETEAPTEPQPVKTSVTVNHQYYTYDTYTGETVQDGSTSVSEAAIEGQSYTATAVTSYNGDAYEQVSVAPAMSIIIAAEAAANVINIQYLRTIDTTPVPVETSVTVNHLYYTYDIYTGETVLDGETSAFEAVIEGQSYTATAVTSYNGNAYEQVSAAPAMSITIAAEAANVINVQYLRTIDTTPINYTPVLSIIKTADKDVYESGETITWTITVKNISAHTAYNATVIDELTGDVWNIEALAPGAESVFTATTANATAGSVRNVAVVSWEDGDEIADENEPNEIKTVGDEKIVGINDPAPENYTPVLSVVKTAGKDVYESGEVITWTITVKNISDYTANNIVVIDELANGYWTIDSLAPGAEKVFTATMENVAAGSVKNTVVVTWEDGDEIPDEEEPNEINRTSDEEVVTVEAPPAPPTPPVIPEPPATEPPATEPPATEPPATEPPATEPPAPATPVVVEGEIDIPDEDVPLAAAPKTGDISALWIAVSSISAAGMIVLGKKREDDEE